MDIPAWLFEISPNSYLNIRDVASLLGITQEAVSSRIKRGRFPEPTQRTSRLTLARKPVRQWRVSAILNYFEGLKVLK